MARRRLAQGNQGRAVREGKNVKTEFCSVLADCGWGKKNAFQVFWGLIPWLVGVNGKNVTALMGFGTESYLIVYL